MLVAHIALLRKRNITRGKDVIPHDGSAEILLWPVGDVVGEHDLLEAEKIAGTVEPYLPRAEIPPDVLPQDHYRHIWHDFSPNYSPAR